MAYTFSVAVQSVFGNVRCNVLSCTADAISGSVQATGMGVLLGAVLAPISMATIANGSPRVKINLSSTSAVLNGSVFVSNVTSGDVFYLTVYGRS